ncbi:MAG TPA: S-layer homology domain-containing protein [Clostridia bacterium]|nr:S-layer homology domain-containing protein [Clostridia bacterium]
MLKRTMTILLCLLIIMQSLPITAFADLNIEGYKTEEELRQAIVGDEKWKENFPNGLFNFIGTKFQVNEKQEFFEIAVVRQGGTNGTASVDFKAIDISAAYGKDYVIRVYENSSKNEMKRNPDAIPMIETIGDNASINISETVIESVYGESKTEPEASTEPEEETQAISGNETVTSSVYSYTDLSGATVTVGEGAQNGVNSLREAREAYLGQKSDRPDWRSVDEKKVEELKAEYDKFLYNVEGAETTLDFADGEYIKYLYLVPLNDKLSESEEQVMFALGKPTGGASRGEFYMAYMNITDDEEPEPVKFEINTPTVEAKDGTASIIVRRTSGQEQYASVAIGTEEDTALSGIDYEPGLKDLFFTPGTSEQKVSVNILDNPGRNKDRQFIIALDRNSEKVNVKAAEAVVTIPGSQDSVVRLRSTAAKDSSMHLTGTPAFSWGQRISSYGYSPAPGQWMITGMDFIRKANFTYKQNKIIPVGYIEGAFYSDDGMQFDYTAGGDGTEDSEIPDLRAVYPIGTMGGISEVSHHYYNNGDGKLDEHGIVSHDYHFKISQEGPNHGWLNSKTYGEVSDYYGVKSVYSSQYVEVQDVKGADSIVLESYANEGNHTSPYISGITLTLKHYNIEISDTDIMKRDKYKINNGYLAKIGDMEFNPGSLYVKYVHSNVEEGYQEYTPESMETPKAYRADRIDFGYQYGDENPSGKYAQYTGFEVKAGNKWIYHKGTEFILDENFFKTEGIWDSIEDGTIEVRPVFSRRQAHFDVRVIANKELVLLNTRALAGGYVSNEWGPLLYTGDVITGVEVGFLVNTPKLPVWSAYTDLGDIPHKQDNSGIVITDTETKKTVDYTLMGTYNVLSVDYEQELIVKANSNVYKDGVKLLPYKLKYSEEDEWTSYSGDAFRAKMADVYTKDENPFLEMEFDYVFNTEFPDPNEFYQKYFGTPQKAVLSVYKNNGTLREDYNIDYDGESFKFSGYLKDLGWEKDDYAGISIEGSGMSGNRNTRTREVIVDFLDNTADGIYVKAPDYEQSGKFWIGNVQTPVRVNRAQTLGNYEMQAITFPGFVAKWGDYTPDTNNNGQIEPEERAELKRKYLERMKNENVDFDRILNEKVYWGNNYSYVPSFFNQSRIYYNFDRLPTDTVQWDASITIWEEFNTVLKPDVKSSKELVKNAEVYFGAKQVEDGNGDGTYTDGDPIYLEGNYYLGQLFYGGQVFNFDVEGGHPKEHTINTAEFMQPYEFKVTVKKDGKWEEKKIDLNCPQVAIEDAITTFSYRIDGSNVGVAPNDSIIRIYDKEGGCIMEAWTGPPAGDEFSYSMNTSEEGIGPGYTMRIAGVFQEYIPETGKYNTHEYPEVRVGFGFTDPPSAMSALASYKTPLSHTLKMIGTINNKYDLGMDVSIKDKLDIHEPYMDSDNNQRVVGTVVIGFDGEYEKSFVKNVEDTGKTPKEDNKDKVEKETKDKDSEDLKEVVNNTPKDADNPPESKGSGGGDFNMTYKISLALALEIEQIYDPVVQQYIPGSYYFSSLVIMATANAEYKKERVFMTPVGVPVTVTLSVHGGATGVLAFEADHKNPYKSEYLIDGGGKASLKPSNYDIYTKFMITPSVTLSAEAGFDYMSLELSGTADFDFEFGLPIIGDSNASGRGGMVISAKLKAKMLFVQKKWTLYESEYINFFGDSPKKLIKKALDDPYGSYLYEKTGSIEAEDILPRDYLEDKGGWNSGGSSKPMLSGVNTGGETVLQNGVFPHPQTKLIPMDEDRTLLLFVEDDESRDDLNRATLMFSILEDGSGTVPAAVYNNGTWDEDPDAFVVDDRILVTWSDAGRTFTGVDTEHDILSAMNITGMWFDTASGTFDGEFAITKTVDGGDGYADVNPRISYDPGTKRLMVYYTKTDHTDHWDDNPSAPEDDTVPYHEEPELVYGDIVNGYNVIAYRYADYNSTSGEFEWNETYTPEEGLDSEKYYGQRFPDLAPEADIEEVEQLITDETVTIGAGDDAHTVTLTHMGTKQIIKPYSGLNDPRITGMDLITHDGLAVFAYIIDHDTYISEQEDHKLYIQTYDFAENKFSNPIEITNDETPDTQPQFVQAGAATYLYWLHDGDIVYTSVSELLDNDKMLKEVTAPGTEEKFFIIDKTDRRKEFHISTAADHENPIEEYSVVTNGNSIYALWIEEETSYKNGLEHGDTGTEDPRNMHKERHIYAACTVPIEEAGGGIKAFPWSEPVQITFEQGANYSNLSYIVPDDDKFLAAYAKYTQQYDEAAGYFTNAGSVRQLAVNLFTIDSEVELGDISTDTEFPMPGKPVNITSVMSNNGLKALENIYFQFYIDVNGVQYDESPWYPEKDSTDTHYLLGGADRTINGCLTVPETLDDIEELKLGVRVKNEAGEILVSKEKELPVGPELEIDVLESRLTDEDEAFVRLYVKNNGNKSFKDNLTISAGDNILHTGQVELKVGEDRTIALVVKLEGAQFGGLSVAEDGSRFDMLTLNYKFGAFEESAELVRQISADAYNELQKVERLKVSRGGRLLGSGSIISIQDGDIVTLDAEIIKKAETAPLKPEQLEVAWSSDNPDIVAVLPDGMLIPMGSGIATVTAAAQPKSKYSASYEDGAFETLDKSYTIPDGVLKETSFTVWANYTPERDDSDDSSSTPVNTVPVQNPISGSVQTSERVEGEKLTLTFDSKSVAEALKGITDTLTLKSSSSDSNIKQLETILTADNLKSIAESKVNRVTISSILGSISLDRKTIDAIAAAVQGKQATIEFSEHDGVIEINIKVDGKKLQSLSGGAILISTAHKPKEAEDVNGILAYGISEDGTQKPIKASMYNPETGEVLFKTDAAGQFTIGYNKVEFSDDLGWADKYITFLSSRNIVTGTGEGVFSKDRAVTRAEFVTMLSRMANDLQLTDTAIKFDDVSSDAWYASPVKWAFENGIVSGSSDTTFSPDSPINREEMATMLYRYAAYAQMVLPQGTEGEFKDNGQLSSWSLAAVNAMKAAGFMVGSGDNSFEPGRISSRAEAAKVIAEILKYSLK